MQPDFPILPPGDAADLLRLGIEAARSGQRERARELFMRAVDQNEENLAAWLWLSGVVDSLEDRVVCLENVLALDPGHVAAQKGLAQVRAQETEQWLRDGIAAAQAGQREQARDLLRRVVDRDERHVAAWLWLSGVVDSPDEQVFCLESVLAVEPEHAAALKGLARLNQERFGTPKPAVVARAETPLTPAGAILRTEPGGASSSWAQLPAAPDPFALIEVAPDASVPASIRQPAVDLDDEYLCPYCTAPTQPDDRRCRACGGQLWLKFRRREKRSLLLWIAIILQVPSVLQMAMVPVMVLMIVAFKVGVPDPADLLDVYFVGASGAVPPELASAALHLFPRWLFFASLLPFLFALGVLVGAFLRWKPVYYLFLANAGLGLLAAVASLAFVSGGMGLVSGVAGVVFSAAMFFTVLQLGDDFAYDHKRILMQVDRGAAGGLDLVMHGRLYAREKMWGLAALHLKRAAGLMPDRLDCQLGLVVAYINLKKYDRAAKALGEATRIAPADPKVQEMQALLDEMRRGEAAN